MLKAITAAFMPPNSEVLPMSRQWPVFVGACVAMFCTVVISRFFAPEGMRLVLAASSGATIILVFAMPRSPFSQPYSVLLGQSIAAAVGVACALLPFDLAINGALGIGLSMLLMYLLRCNHPPAGATAMIPIVMGAKMVGGFTFVVFPVVLNMVVILLVGVIFHRFIRGIAYPTTMVTKSCAEALLMGSQRRDGPRNTENIQPPLNNGTDVTSDASKFANITCAQAMCCDMQTLSLDTPLDEAWRLLDGNGLTLLPVLDGQGHVVGTLSYAEQLMNLVVRDQHQHCQPQLVSELMTSTVTTIHQEAKLITLLPFITDKAFHPMVVIDDRQQFVGLLTQADLIRALQS